MRPYINIHAHHRFKDDGSFTLINFLVGQDQTLPKGLFSAGIHPWFVTDLAHQQALMMQLGKRQECLAIGECGLDKFRGPDLKEQLRLFEWHIQLSETLKKPLIIHCVKSFDALLRLHRDLNPTSLWILHGYQGKPELTRQLVSTGICLSYGASLLDEHKSSVKESLKETPLDQLYLETDEWEGDIAAIYRKAAEIRGMGESNLVDSIEKRFRKFLIKGT